MMGRVGRSLPAARDADRQGEVQQVPSIHKIQVGHIEGAQDDAAGFQATVDATVKAALAGRKFNEGDAKQAACNNWDYTGTCSYGDRCRFSHDAEAGYKGTNTGVRTDADKDTQMAIAAFAAEKGHVMHDVTVGMIEADGGIQKWKLDLKRSQRILKHGHQGFRLLVGSGGLQKRGRLELDGWTWHPWTRSSKWCTG